MKLAITVLALSIFFCSDITAQDRVLINEKQVEKCSVEIEENFPLGVLAAKREIEEVSFIQFDELIFIESRDGEKRCDFVFDLYSKKKFIGSAEIELSKPFFCKK